MAQCLRLCSILTEDLRWVPRTRKYNDTMPFFGPYRRSVHMYPAPHHIHVVKSKIVPKGSFI